MALTMSTLWDAYCKPCPSNIFEMLTLIFLCCLLSLCISALLFVWMAFSLAYDHFMAVIVAGVCAGIMTPLLILIHPVRCVITVTVPSLGTKQGRKILLSIALLFTLSTCVPNMTYNMSHSLRMLQCSANNITQGVVQSNRVPFNALNDIRSHLSGIPEISGTQYDMKLENAVDFIIIQSELSTVFDNVRAKVTLLHNTLGQISKISKKMTAGLLVLLMIGSSVAYVNGYLMNIKHDNVYQSRQLREGLLTVTSDDTLPKSCQKIMVKTSGVRMSVRELQHGLWGMLGLMFYAMICGLILGLEHFVYWTLQSLLSWTSDIPVIRAAVHVHMTIHITYIGLIPEEKMVYRSYPYSIELLPAGCVHSLLTPESSTLTSVCVFLAVGFFMLLMEVFARRLRRKVCASFYPRREEQRTEYLIYKILNKREKQLESDD